MVLDFFTPVILHSSLMSLLSKFLPWSLNPSWEIIMYEELFKQGLGCGFGSLVGSQDRLGKLGEMVCNDQYVLNATFGGFKREEVYAD